MLTLGFVCRLSTPTNRLLDRSARRMGHDVRLIGDPERPLPASVVSGSPDVLLGRVSAGDGNVEFQLLHQRQLEISGVPALNRAEAVGAALRKSGQALTFARVGVPHPSTCVATPYADPEQLADHLGLPLVLKPDTGLGGNGIFCPRTVEEVRQDLRDAGMSGLRVLVAQRFLPEAVRNVRVVVINGVAVAAMERAAPAGGWLSNMSQGATGHRVTLSTEERELATRAATELGLDMAGVDVVRTEDGPVVLEVNTAPGLVKTESVTGVDLVTSVLEALVMRANPDQDLPAPVPTISA